MSSPSPEHLAHPGKIPEFDISFAEPDAIDQLRHDQREAVHQAGANAMQQSTITEMLARGPTIHEVARAEAARHSVEEYVDANLPPDLVTAHPELRDRLIGLILPYSVHHMNDRQWKYSTRGPDGHRLPSGRDELRERLADFKDEHFLAPLPSRSLPPHLLALAALKTNSERMGERMRNHRGRTAAIIGGVVLLGVGLALWKSGALDGIGHFFSGSHGPATHPTGGPRSGVGAAPPRMHPHGPNRTSPPPSRHNPNFPPEGIRVFAPEQTANVQRTWAGGTNANHIFHIIPDKHGSGVTIELQDIQPGGTTLNGRAVNPEDVYNLRANTIVNLNGHQETVSIPMPHGRAHLIGKIAGFIRRRGFATLEAVRMHGPRREDVFSTVVGNGQRISGKFAHHYATMAQHLFPSGKKAHPPQYMYGGNRINYPATSDYLGNPAEIISSSPHELLK